MTLIFTVTRSTALVIIARGFLIFELGNFSLDFYFISLKFFVFQFYKFICDDAFFQPELGWKLRASLGRTEIADGLNWRMPDRLG